MYPTRDALGAVLFRLLAVLFALGYAALLAPLLGLVGPAWDAGGGEEIHRIHHAGAALVIVLLVVGLLAQQRPGGHPAAFRQAVLTILALEAAGLIMGDPDNHGGNSGVIDPLVVLLAAPVVVLAALHPSRPELLRLAGPSRPVSTALALAGAVPFIRYGVEQAMLQRNSWPPAADPHHNGHWLAMAILAFAIPLVALLAARDRDGWRVPAWSAAVASVAFGIASAAHPGLASSAGGVWGPLAALWGLALLGAVQWESRPALSRRAPLG